MPRKGKPGKATGRGKAMHGKASAEAKLDEVRQEPRQSQGEVKKCQGKARQGKWRSKAMQSKAIDECRQGKFQFKA
jgi:hypothetical protein